MKCPNCGAVDDRVIDSRLGRDNAVIRRRRECLNCKKRFTTYERIEESLPFVIKKDGSREAFDRRKIVEGMRRACQKRPVKMDDIQRVADMIEQDLTEKADKEVRASDIGERVMEELRLLDDVAYVRFASVYRSFHTIKEFIQAIDELTAGKTAIKESETPEEPDTAEDPANETSGIQDSI